ncbi:1-acyl-sn-glycerol-3-phosphate acyltransferase [Zhouia amylolytica]|uniref:1-acyl-sn-glycerol-3-phosphate acyltransferase n=2 Tax=Zhouia amylolytica TaxID=376730 RepID=W2UJI4_9FLAO|nr:lysophospholipid acyltransferase family protein [Zhouia amylolytica]ETN94129.1 1-acyl-sn-glycerol-3-phosphate acyltransferase [Zhouia amylolytica AD3]SFS41442.1 1-acyl-sn-glycerol-3-phosphate acyltransferase [Zhouia amylolytica]
MIVLLKKFLILVWRIWFYVLVAVPIIIMFPVLLVLSSSDRLYPQFFWVARNVWANIILYGMGFIPRIDRQQKMEKGKSYMLIANHTSMTDIMLMLKASPNPFVFVGKKELVKIPVFGFFYKRVCIMVDRNSAGSRTAVYKRAQKRLHQGLSVCIFPEGGVPDEDILLDKFKDGAFRLAIQHRIPIVPMVFYDNKRRFPYDFFEGSLGLMRVKKLRFIETNGHATIDKNHIREKCWSVIHDELSR